MGLQDESGWTALHFAVHRNQADVLELLCAAPSAAAAFALRTSGGHTPLAIAVLLGHAVCADVLRAHGGMTLE